MLSPLSALTRHFPPEGASTSKYFDYIPAPIGGRMSEGQEGGLFLLIADVKYLIAVVIFEKHSLFSLFLTRLEPGKEHVPLLHCTAHHIWHGALIVFREP